MSHTTSICTEGIILRISPFQDFHRILTVFTNDAGLIKVFVNNGGQPSSYDKHFLQPFCRIELIVTKGKGDLYYYKDGSLIENFYLRTPPELSGRYLTGAAAIAQALLLSQFPEKPAPNLFLLLNAYLKYLAGTGAFYHLIASFQLKLLVHDGLLCTEPLCSHCNTRLTCIGIGGGGEFFCKEHAPLNTFFLNEAESEQLLLLSKSRSLEEITKTQIETTLPAKIALLFEQAIQ